MQEGEDGCNRGFITERSSHIMTCRRTIVANAQRNVGRCQSLYTASYTAISSDDDPKSTLKVSL